MNDEQREHERQMRMRFNWTRLYSVLPRNPKILSLKSDSQRFAYIVTLCAARDEQVQGEWIDRRYLAAALGKYARHIDALLEAELLRELPDGRISVPQWDHWNPADNTHAERQQRYVDNLKRKARGEPPIYARDASLTSRDTSSYVEESRDETRRDDPRGVESSRVESHEEQPRSASDLPDGSVAPLLCMECDKPFEKGDSAVPEHGQYGTAHYHRRCLDRLDARKA